MDTLKKQILITLFLFLIAGTAGLFLLLTNFLRQNDSPAELPAQKDTETAQKQISTEPATDLPADVPALNLPTDEQLDEEALTLLEMEELKPFFKDDPQLKIACLLNKNPFTLGAAYAVGINYFHQQRAKGEIDAQEQEAKQQAYKETLDRQWNRRLEILKRQPHNGLDNTMPENAGEVSPQPPALDEWTEGPCETAALPAGNPPNLTCRKGAKGFCAFFENGAPYFCKTKDGKKSYLLNKWGSSITVTQKTANGQTVSEQYYANGEFSRATDYDLSTGSHITIWLDKGNSFRLTRTDKSGKILDKYYFTAGKPYVRYQGGNDMGEINGHWELKNGLIFADGKPFYAIAAPKLAPDVCQIFNGYCPLQKMPYLKNEPLNMEIALSTQ